VVVVDLLGGRASAGAGLGLTSESVSGGWGIEPAGGDAFALGAAAGRA
jgi:hypothetical protein